MSNETPDTASVAPSTDPAMAETPGASASAPGAQAEAASATGEAAAKKVGTALSDGGNLPLVADPAAPPKVDAVICIPGIGSGDGIRFDDVAKRLVTAFERAADGKAVFSTAVRDAKTRDGKTYNSVAIRRQDTPKGEPRDVLHLYEYDYRSELSRGLEESTPAVQATAIAWTLAFSFPSVWWALVTRQSKDWVQRLQVIYGTALFAGMAFYLVLLLIGSGIAVKEATTGRPTAAAQTRTTSTGAPAPPAATQRTVGPLAASAPPLPRGPAAKPGTLAVAGAWIAGAAEDVWGFLKAVGRTLEGGILWLAGLVIVIPLAGSFVRFNIREALSRAAPLLTTATAYLSSGKRRTDLIGGLGDVLNFIDEQAVDGPEYEQVHVVAYSFGSVVAIDSLFPHEGAVSRQFERVQTLVTIGCPYDFVRTYWPKYFQNRYAVAAAARPRWINIFSPIDVLGSNFIDEPAAKERRTFINASPSRRDQMRQTWDSKFDRGVELMDGTTARPRLDDNITYGPGQGGTASLGEWFSFIGFRAHGMYWSRESASAPSCFDTILKRLYAERDPAGALR